MEDINAMILIIILYVNSLNETIKKQSLLKVDEKKQNKDPAPSSEFCIS